MIRMFSPVRMIVRLHHEKVDITINSSPNRLIEGGKARFVRLAIIHHIPISGNSICRPRVRSKVRLCTRS